MGERGALWKAVSAGRLANEDGARLGALLVMAGQLLALPSVLTYAVRPGQRPGLLVFSLLNGPIALLVLRVVKWARHDRRWLMIWPAWTVIGTGLGGVVTYVHGAPALSALFMLAFFYVGLTQRRGTSVACLPVAIPCWIAVYGGWNHELLLRAPLAIGIWVLVAETIARLREEVQTLASGLAKDASTDVLTGLANRRRLDSVLGSLALGDAVVLLDIDHFKALNDQFGHEAGDKVLSDLGAAVRAVVRTGDAAIRLGGEEVMLVLTGAGAEGANEVLARLRHSWTVIQPGVTFSAGIAVVGPVAASDAISAADTALYSAKLGGRDRSALAPVLAV